MTPRITGIILIMLLFAGVSSGYAAVPGEEKITPFQLAAFHPFQLFTEDWSVYGLRVNVLYGVNRSVYGIDGGFINRTENMYGVQAGVCNIAQQNIGGLQIGAVNISPNTARYTIHLGIIGNVGDTVHPGIQIGGIFNSSMDMMEGLQAAGLINVAGNVAGVQAAGLGNVFIGNVRGMQVGGLGNFGFELLGSNCSMTGLQIGGFFNFSGNTSGIQVATLLNRTVDDVHGVQLGLINIADRVKGVQVGLVNITRRMAGVQIGLVNIIQEGAVPMLPLFNASSSF